MTWERREYEVETKATDSELEEIRYSTIAHHYAMQGGGTFFEEWKRLHDFIDYVIWAAMDIQGNYPEMRISEKMDCTAHWHTMFHKFGMIKKIIRQAFGRIGPSHGKYENYYRTEACDHLRPSNRTGRPQMMINWQDMKEIKNENGGPSVWVRGDRDGGNDENQDAQQT